ncbi:hypothetical protein NQ314_019545 [Rhamnusium bicolor]|uniref:C2H2-type domain-containing protein n=1 Tax=Rhamnusium bicolor TaxID=1586634 RepID=A0AAV8WNP6_9CUCU|nr:hypothetical protein NQ314_019545 [Rhamnusium bicolor]
MNDDDFKPTSDCSSSISDDDDFVSTTKIKNKATKTATVKIDKYLQCRFCLKYFAANSNLYRHSRQCQLNSTTNNATLSCPTCCIVFSRSDSLKKHLSACTIKSERRMACWHDCPATFYKKTDMIKHLEIQHKLKVAEEIELKFQNATDFKKWKDDIEKKNILTLFKVQRKRS